MNSYHYQRGASAPLVLLFVVMAAIVLTIVFKLYPAFYENWQIQHVMESFQDEVDLKEAPVKEIQRRFENRLLTNNVRSFKTNENVAITKIDGTLTIYAEYEVRIPIYKNIDAVVRFEEILEKTL